MTKITREDIRSAIEEMLGAYYGPDQLDDMGAKGDLWPQIDSLDRIDLLLGVEIRFDVTISDVEGEMIRSIDDLVTTIETHLTSDAK